MSSLCAREHAGVTVSAILFLRQRQGGGRARIHGPLYPHPRFGTPFLALRSGRFGDRFPAHVKLDDFKRLDLGVVDIKFGDPLLRSQALEPAELTALLAQLGSGRRS